jgi:KDO2-lipid IV(A) lauroyltransferase
MLNEIRTRPGVEFRPVSVGATKRIVQTLRAGGTVALMGDRDIEGPRIKVPFFGKEAWLPAGPIEVGLRTNSAIFPSFCVRRDRYGLNAYLEEPIHVERTGNMDTDVRLVMTRYVERLEWWLRKEPDQWLVLERIWEPGATAAGSARPADAKVAAST